MKMNKLVAVVALSAVLVADALSVSALGVPATGVGVIQAIGPLASPLPVPAPGTCVAVTGANIRTSPSARAKIIGRIPRGGKFVKSGRKGTFLSGSSSYGSGWVYAWTMRCR